MQPKNFRAVGSDHTTIHADERGRDREFIGKCGKFISTTILIGIIADDDLVVAHFIIVKIVRIVGGLNHKTTAFNIPRECNRIDDIRLASEEGKLKAWWNLGKFHRFFRAKRLLRLSDYLTFQITGKLDFFHLQRGKIECFQFAVGLRAYRPIYGAFQQIMKLRQIPNAVIVARCGVKHASLALIAHPCPWLLLTCLQDHTVVAVIVVLIGFVPSRKALEAIDDRVLSRRVFRFEHARGVRLETTADELDELR